jgi:hypothetical protein
MAAYSLAYAKNALISRSRIQILQRILQMTGRLPQQAYETSQPVQELTDSADEQFYFFELHTLYGRVRLQALFCYLVEDWPRPNEL